MNLGKGVVIGLVAVSGVATLALLSSSDPILPTLRSPVEEPPLRRGDDPTYAEELKTMSALLQEMRYELQQQEQAMVRERAEISALISRETQRAVNRSSAELEQLNRELRGAQTALDQKIEQAATGTADVQTLQQAFSTLKTEQRRLREQLSAAERRNGPESAVAATETATQEVARLPEANRVLHPPGPGDPATSSRDLSTRLEERLASLKTQTARPGAIQTDASVLDQLRQLPGMSEMADRLAAHAVPNPSRDRLGGKGKSSVGLQEGYVTLKPYVAGLSERNPHIPGFGSSPAGRNAELLIPQRYPLEVKTGKSGTSAVIPVYTIPDAATLVNNSTMTPLVGRVPVRGQLRDPFRFKLITGSTNLATNGHRIPGIVNAVWTGYAVGLREQSCVRAYIDTVTFTFQDGRIHTVNQGKGDDEAVADVTDNLGYVTDLRGNPCIQGQYFNNARQYLAGRGIASFLDGLAKAYSRSQVTIERTDDGILAYVDGDVYEYAAGQGLSGATGEIADYIRERAVDAFDVVYVPPGINVQIFVETEIPIDYDTLGRRLHYTYSEESPRATLD